MVIVCGIIGRLTGYPVSNSFVPSGKRSGSIDKVPGTALAGVRSSSIFSIVTVIRWTHVNAYARWSLRARISDVMWHVGMAYIMCIKFRSLVFSR